MLLSLAVSYTLIKGTWVKSALDRWFSSRKKKEGVVEESPLEHRDFDPPKKL